VAANEPMFTVVLPTYNRAAVVMDAVLSVLSQTYTDFELIIVDDQSTDDTKAVLGQITDPRVAVVTNNRTKGEAGARNTGVLGARGQWVCQIDSDDLWPDDMLARFADAIAGAPADVGIVYGSLGNLDTRTGQVTGIRRAKMSGFVHQQFLEDHFICHCAAALKTSALWEIGGYDEMFRQKTDSDLLLRMTEHYAVLPVPDLVYLYRIGGSDQVTANRSEFLAAYEQYMRKHSRLLAKEPRAGNWRRAARTWVRLVPSMWKAPQMFLHAQRRMGCEVIEVSKRRVPRLYGFLRKHRDADQ
jgi:glycosyltransferase involved in cell wall biosynthesis